MWTEARRQVPASALDTALALVDLDGTAITSGDDLPFALSTDSAVALREDGVVAVGAEDETAGPYHLCAEIAGDTEQEPNDTALYTPELPLYQSSPWPVVPDRVLQIVGELADGYDADYHRLRAERGETWRAALLDGAHGLPEIVDFRLFAGDGVFDWVAGDPLLAAEHDPGPAALGYPPDAAVLWHSSSDEDLYLHVNSDVAGWYVALADRLDPDGIGSDLTDPVPVAATAEEGAWVARAAGDVGPDPVDTVTVDVSGVPDVATATLSVFVQSRAVGARAPLDVVVRDGSGNVLFAVPPDEVLAGDPAETGIDLSRYDFDGELVFVISSGYGTVPTPWFLTVRIQPPA